VTDPTCIATCSCDREYAGIGCRSRVEDISNMEAQRHVLLQAIHYTALEQQHNVESVTEIARRLMDVLPAVDEINTDAGMYMQHMHSDVSLFTYKFSAVTLNCMRICVIL